MKAKIEVEIELDDEYVEEWKKNYLNYHSSLYKSEEKAVKALKENPIEKAIANNIEDLVVNYIEGIIDCNIKVISE